MGDSAESRSTEPDEARRSLTGPAGRFELVAEEIGGRRTSVYRERMRTLREIPALARRRGDDRTFIVYGEERIGFETFVDTANSVSTWLAGRGVHRGDRVAILAPNRPEWCLAFWGAIDLGAVAVGVNGWWSAEEIVHALRLTEPKVLVVDDKRLQRIADRLGACDSIELIVLLDENTSASRGRPLPTVPFQELASQPTPETPQTAIDEDDPAVILFTSGTTGRAKGAISTHRNMIAALQNSRYAAAYAASLADPQSSPSRPDDEAPVSLFTSPLFHVSGCHSTLVTGLFSGLRLVMMPGRFDPIEALRLIERERVTIWGTVPTMVNRLCQAPQAAAHDTSSVRTVAFGGSPSAADLQRLVRSTFANVRGASNAYGLTESNSSATVLAPTEARQRPGSVGRPLPTVEVRIVDGDGAPMPCGETGEVVLRGATITPGYWNDPEATAEAIDGDGWLHTGDLGHLDADGYLYITDRSKDVIIRGGENVYCVEIEQRLIEHPDVLDAAVVGMPDADLGERVVAVVHPANPDIAGRALQEWVAGALASFKVPSEIRFSSAPLPRNATGKVLKPQIRADLDAT